MENNELTKEITNPQQYSSQITKTNLVSALPLERLSLIHRDIKAYHQKWNKDKVVQIADLSTIDNTYTALLHNFSRITSATGAGIYLFGEINGDNSYKGIGGSITVTSLCVDFLVSSYKERRFRPEERKKEKDKFIADVENLYNSYEELMVLLQDFRNSNSLEEISKLVNSLKEELTKIIEKGKIKENNDWEERLSYVFWSLEKDKSSDIEELILLNNGVKALDSWDKLPLSGKAQSWLNSLLISRRNDAEWTEWKQKWEDRRNEHQKIKHLTSILQTAISEHKQGISSEEIKGKIKNSMLKLEVIQLYHELISLNADNAPQTLSIDVEKAVNYLRSEIDKANKDKEPLASTSNNNNSSSTQLLEDKNTLSTTSTPQSTNVFRKRTISNSKENESTNREVYELVDLQIHEGKRLQSQVQIPPK